MRSTAVVVPFQAIGLVLLLLLCAAALAAPATEPAGRVIVAVGDVTAEATDGTTRRLRRRDAVYSGDTLRTGANGRAQLRFTDRSLVSLRPGTEFEVEAYSFTASSPTTATSRMRLNRGSFATTTGTIARRNRASYRMSTPLAVIGVRGTTWEALHDPAGETLLGVSDGGITAETLTGESADVGPDTGFPFARVGADGSLELLSQRPPRLQVTATPEVDEETEEDGDGSDSDGDGSDSDGDGSDGDGGEGSSDDDAAGFDSNADSEGSGDTAALGTSAAADVAGADTAAEINPAEVGDADPGEIFEDFIEEPVIEEPVVEEPGLQGIAAGVDRDDGAVTDLLGGQVTLAADGSPVFTETDEAGAVFATLALGGATDTFITTDFGGIPGVQAGTFQPGETSADLAQLSFASSTTVDQQRPLLYVFGPAPDFANLTVDAAYRITAVSATGNTEAGDVLSVAKQIGAFKATLDLASGTLGNGFIDLTLDDEFGSEVFFDFDGTVADGVVELVLSDVELDTFSGSEQTEGLFGFAEGDGIAAGGFIGAGEGFAAAFDLSFDNGWTLYGTFAAVQEPNTLGPNPAEASALAVPDLFGFVFEDGEALPVRAIGDAVTGDVLFGTNDVDFVGDQAYADTDYEFFGRLGDARVINLTPSLNTPGTVGALFQWSADTGPYTLIDAGTGVGFDFDDDLLFGLAVPADIADLTGFQFFVSSRFAGGLTTGAVTIPTFTEESLGSNSLGLVELVTSSFAVDFASGVITDGLLVVDLAENVGSTEPLFEVRHQFSVFFAGQTVARAGMLHADIFAQRTLYDGLEVPAEVFLGGVFTSGNPATAEVGTGAGFLGQYTIFANPASGPVDAFGVFTAEGREDARIPDAARLAEFDRFGVLQRTRSPRMGPATAPGPDGPEILANLGFTVDGPAGTTFSAIPKAYRGLNDLLYSGNGNTVFQTTAVGGPGSSVDWGVWDTGFDGVNPAPFQQPFTDALGQTQTSNFNSYWATLIPADVATLIGVATYSGTDVLGRYVDEDSAAAPLDFLSASFDVDFDSGIVSNGTFSAGSSDMFVSASFDGQVLNGILDGNVTGGSLTNNISASVFNLSLERSDIDGVFAINDEFVGAFYFDADDPPLADLDQQDFIEGVMLLRRSGGP